MRMLHEESRKLVNELIREEIMQRCLVQIRRHDNETYSHSIRVGLLSIDLGYDIPFESHDLRLLGYSGLLHDIGKIKIPKQVLSKKSLLNNIERDILKEHPRLGFLELENTELGEFTKKVRQIIVAHHEFKKNPYPRSGRDKRQIPRKNERRKYDDKVYGLAEIVAVSDMYDALASESVYNPALPKEKIKRIMREEFTGNQIYIERVLQRF